jgi:hypothetical protein
MPFKPSTTTDGLQGHVSPAQLGATYCPRDRFRKTWKPAQIIRHLVRRGADECFAALIYRTDQGKRSVVASEINLAKQLNVSTRTVRSYIRLLESAKLISTRREWQDDPAWKHPKLVNRYTFHDHQCLRDYLGDDRPVAEPEAPAERPFTAPPKRQQPTPIHVVPPQSPPQLPPQLPQTVVNPTHPPTEIPDNMAMLCWYSKEMQTMMWLFYPLDQPTTLQTAAAPVAAAAPDTAKKSAPKAARATKPRTRNPVPEDNPYYQAVRTIANTIYFRTSDPAAYEDVAAEFSRLKATPEIAGKIADEIVRSSGYQFRMIADLFSSYRSGPAPEAAYADNCPAPPKRCGKCIGTGVVGDTKDTMVFCSCAKGRERVADGWLDIYETNNTEHWINVFRRSNVPINRKPPERETGQVPSQQKAEAQ